MDGGQMEMLLANPAVQSGIIPFAVALIVAFVLRPAGWYWLGLAFAAGFFASVLMTPGAEINFTPKRSSEKIMLVTLGAFVLGLLLDAYPFTRRFLPALVGIAAAGSILWVLEPKLGRWEGTDLWLYGGLAVLYCGWLAAMGEPLRQRGVSASLALMALGFGTGGSALLGATAFYGQLGIAIGASAAAVVLVTFFCGASRIGSNMTTPASVLAGVLGVAAVAYSKLPWYSLVPLVFIPLVAALPEKAEWPRWMQAGVKTLVILPFAIAAVLITWRVEGPPPM